MASQEVKWYAGGVFSEISHVQDELDKVRAAMRSADTKAALSRASAVRILSGALVTRVEQLIEAQEREV